MVNNVWCKTLILKKTIVSVSTIAIIIGFWWIKNRAVMCRYNGVHVTHATITYLNRIFIKNFVKLNVLNLLAKADMKINY